MVEIRVLECETQGGNEWTAQGDNPFSAPTILHPNVEGDVSTSWLIEGYPFAGAALLSGECAIGDPKRTYPVILDVSIEQSGIKTGATIKLVNGGTTRYRVGFTSDGSPYRLTFTARVEDPAHFPGSVFQVGPLQVFSPIGDSIRPWLYQLMGGEAGALVSCNQGGLMNRLVPLMSLCVIGRKTGRAIYAFWGKNQHCAANLDDIFDLPGRSDPSVIADDHEVFSDYLENSTPLELSEGARNKLVYGIRPVKSVNPAIECSYDDVAQEFKEQPLSLDIRRELKKFDDVDFSNTIALHIRRPFPNGAFAEQEEAKFTLGIDVFFDLIRAIRRDAPSYKNILLCTNSPEYEEKIRSEFGEYIIVYEKTTIDNTTDARAVQEAVVDIILMSRCPIMFSQETTAFGHFAHAVGRNKLFCVTKKTDAENLISWQFERGVHIDEITASRSAAGALVKML